MGSVLDHKSRRAAEFTSHGEALHQPRNEHGYGCEQTDGGVRRHDGHHARAEDHELNRQRERSFASGAIGVGPENHGSKRPGQVRQAERHEGEQQGNYRVRIRKEDPGDGRGKVAVNQQVEPLQRVADGRGGNLQSPTGVFGRRRHVRIERGGAGHYRVAGGYMRRNIRARQFRPGNRPRSERSLFYALRFGSGRGSTHCVQFLDGGVVKL